MDILIMIVCAVITIGFLVFIHEGGHYLAARAFGVRVTEFMLGLPGPSVGFTKGETRFGVTAVPLGGYAKVCGMESGPMQPHLKEVLAALYRRGTANMEDIALDCDISNDEAYEALEELVEWGSCEGPTKQDEYNTYRARRVEPSKKARKAATAAASAKAVETVEGAENATALVCTEKPVAYELGQARPVDDEQALFDSEYARQYRSLPFWKRTIILLAGIAMNLLFAILVFILAFSIIGIQYTPEGSTELVTYHATVVQSLQAGFTYIAMVVQAVVNLFNPSTAAQTVSDSTSIVGIAVMSKDYFQAGIIEALEFMAMISVSLGIMNLLPIPPLDGGRFVVEVFQKISSKLVSQRAMNYMSLAGMALFLVFFVIMLNQDIQRFVFGNWG